MRSLPKKKHHKCNLQKSLTRKCVSDHTKLDKWKDHRIA